MCGRETERERYRDRERGERDREWIKREEGRGRWDRERVGMKDWSPNTEGPSGEA